MSLLALAGLSVRLVAEAAQREGLQVAALDLFGDADTRRAAWLWQPIGQPDLLQIDGVLLLTALTDLARTGRAWAWVAGSGLEGQPTLLARGAAVLPLLGTAPADVARLRDPAQFFAFLDRHGIAHPAVRLASTAAEPAEADEPDPAGAATVAPQPSSLPVVAAARPIKPAWLVKDSAGCGGWHIRRAKHKPVLAAGEYLQQEQAGQPMSVTFVGNGRAACLLGLNQLLVQPWGDRPHAYGGLLGPLPWPPGLQDRLQHIVDRLTEGFALRGLASLDFLLDGADIQVLEVNPRPPASTACYGPWRPMAAHVRACLHGELPAAPPANAMTGVVGHSTVLARRTLHLDAQAAQQLASRPDTHDLPAQGQHFEPGMPVCTVGARGTTAREVLARLQQARESAWTTLETCP